MNDKKTTSMIFKTLNFNNEVKKNSRNGGGSRQLVKSLRHSLRIPSTNHKSLEWLEDQSHRNLIWLPQSGVVQLDSIAIGERERLLAQIINDANESVAHNSELTNLKELRAKLKDAVNRASKKETAEVTIRAFQQILNAQGFANIEEVTYNLEQCQIARKNQKVETAKKFLECHNKIQNFKNIEVRKNQAVVQEAFFKFPAINGVHGLQPEERIKHIKEFYELVFPEFPILFIVFHGDEDADRTDASDHPHIFISTKNTNTGKYDLRARQISRVNLFLKQKYPHAKQISEKPDFLESQLLFGYLQEMFYGYTNNKLLKNTAYVAKKIKPTEEHMQKLRQIKYESHKPKSERAFNLYHSAKVNQSMAEKHTALAEAERCKANTDIQDAKRLLSENIKKTRNAIEHQKKLEHIISNMNTKALELQRESEKLKKNIERESLEYARLQAAVREKNAELESFETNLAELIEAILNWLEELFKSKRKSIQERYLSNAQQAYARIAAFDKTYNKLFTNIASNEIDRTLQVLDKNSDIFPNLPKSKDVKRLVKY